MHNYLKNYLKIPRNFDSKQPLYEFLFLDTHHSPPTFIYILLPIFILFLFLVDPLLLVQRLRLTTVGQTSMFQFLPERKIKVIKSEGRAH